MYLEDFNNNEDATYDELAIELLNLDNDAFGDLFSSLALHSDLGELEKYIELAERAIQEYTHTSKFRREAGRGN